MRPPAVAEFPKVVQCRLGTMLLHCFVRVSSRYWRVSEIPMLSCNLFRWLRVLAIALSCCSAVSIVQAQGAKQTVPQSPIHDSDPDHIKERNEWFFRGRLVHGKSSAELRRRAYQAKLQMRARHAAALAATARANGQAAVSSGSISSRIMDTIRSHAPGLRCDRQWYAGLPPGLWMRDCHCHRSRRPDGQYDLHWRRAMPARAQW